MYRLLLILALLTLGESRHHHHTRKCHGKRLKEHKCSKWEVNDHPDVLFHQLARDVLDADRKAQNFCNDRSNITREVYGQDYYKIITPISGFTNRDGDVTIKIKHRVIYIKVKKMRQEKNSSESKESKESKEAKDSNMLEDVKILPEIVNTKEGTWRFGIDFSQLEISFPYKIRPGEEVTKACNVEFNDHTTHVHKEMEPTVNRHEMVVPFGPPLSLGESQNENAILNSIGGGVEQNVEEPKIV